MNRDYVITFVDLAGDWRRLRPAIHIESIESELPQPVPFPTLADAPSRNERTVFHLACGETCEPIRTDVHPRGLVVIEASPLIPLPIVRP